MEKLLGLRKVAGSARGVSCLLLYMVGTARVVFSIFYKLVHQGFDSKLRRRGIPLSRTQELHRGCVYRYYLWNRLFRLAFDRGFILKQTDNTLVEELLF